MYSSTQTRNTYSYLNDDSSKFFSLTRGNSSFNIVVLYPNNGSHIETKIIASPVNNITSIYFDANGRFTSNILMIYYCVASSSTDYLFFINTDSWTSTSYVGGKTRRLLNYSPIHSAQQIVLLFNEPLSGFDYTVQSAYDKLNMTEFFSQ